MSAIKKPQAKSPLLLLTFFLIAIGLVFISISSLSEANSTVGDKFFFIKKQFIWMSLGLVLFYIFSKIKLDLIKKYSFHFYVITIVLLVVVLIPSLGNKALGARRWIDLGLLTIQPSELLKFASITYFPFLFSQENKRTIKNLIIYLAIPFLLIIAQPNLSTAILVSLVVVTLYYLAGGEVVQLFGLASIATIISILLILVSPYRFSRLHTLLDPSDNSATAYHTNQIVISLASGGFFGKGLANSDQKYKYLPKLATDSILAVIGEETGFIGVCLILFIYLYLIIYLFKLSQSLTDPFSSLLIAGIGCWITYQSLINIAAIAALIPLTGIPLPFISYGGSSLITLMASIGLARNIEKHAPRLVYLVKDDQNPQDHHHHRNSPHSSSGTDKTTEKGHGV